MKNNKMYLKDRVDVDSEMMEVLLDYFGNDVTIKEIEESHFRGLLIEQKFFLTSWQMACDVVERARKYSVNEYKTSRTNL